MATSKIIVLITGANSGIGFGLASQLVSKGPYHVLLGARSVDKGTAAVDAIKARKFPGSVECLEIDVTNDDSISSAFDYVKKQYGKLDWLVNNAGIAGSKSPLRQQFRQAFETNATGVVVVTDFFAPLLKKSTSSPRILNISSGMGSIAQRNEPTSATYKYQEVQYRASKAALNMITSCQKVEYEADGIKVFAVCPGFVQSNISDLNTAENGARSAEDAALPLIDILEGKRDAEAGKFLHKDGTYPW